MTSVLSANYRQLANQSLVCQLTSTCLGSNTFISQTSTMDLNVNLKLVTFKKQAFSFNFSKLSVQFQTLINYHQPKLEFLLLMDHSRVLGQSLWRESNATSNPAYSKTSGRSESWLDPNQVVRGRSRLLAFLCSYLMVLGSWYIQCFMSSLISIEKLNELNVTAEI